VAKVHKENEDRIGRELLASIHKLTGFDPNA
jgi:hypothetical protein